jgi:hypothetical protein
MIRAAVAAVCHIAFYDILSKIHLFGRLAKYNVEKNL